MRRTTPMSWTNKFIIIAAAVFAFALIFMLYGGSAAHTATLHVFSSRKSLSLISWNMAAINNNPFEYWITYNEEPLYDKTMKAVSAFIESPGDKDVRVDQVFTDSMFEELCSRFVGYGIGGVNETTALWNSDYRKRKIISEFIKDEAIGKKRLASMPDRVTNTINLYGGAVANRPTVINCYDSNFVSMQDWWTKWRYFMFGQTISIDKSGVKTDTNVIKLLQPILRAKYPAISDAEEKISIPLQTLSMAIFDAILVHMMNSITPTWQSLRGDICKSLNLHKNDRSLEILETTYPDEDIYFLQEVSFSFIKTAKTALASSYDVHAPSKSDGERDQNSVILLRKAKYKDVTEVTQDIIAGFPPGTKVPIADGDLLAILATDSTDDTKYLFCSFHGDTNGLATVPVVEAVHKYATSKGRDAKLLFGMDANTYETPDKDQQGVVDFAKKFTALQLSSCYGDVPDPSKYTTFAARTHLQPQLNKAVSYDQKDVKGDKNPKDFVLFFKSDFEVISAERDNTGARAFTDNMVIPTLQFPSDHAITFSSLLENKA